MRTSCKYVLPAILIILCFYQVGPGSSRAWAAHSPSHQPPGLCALSPLRLNPSTQSAVWNWLNCEECISSDLKAVVKLGAKVIPVLEKFLCNGATPAKMAASSHFLFQEYKKLLEFQQTIPDAPTLPSQHDYVRTHLVHLSVQYQVRAATALGAIATPQAIQSLHNACSLNLPNTVRDVIKEILGKCDKPVQ